MFEFFFLFFFENQLCFSSKCEQQGNSKAVKLFNSFLCDHHYFLRNYCGHILVNQIESVPSLYFLFGLLFFLDEIHLEEEKEKHQDSFTAQQK